MNSSNEIGGYFELSLPPAHDLPFAGAILVNSGRHALEYILKAQAPSLVYIPTFTCDAILEPLKRTNTAYEFYPITEQFEIAGEITLGAGEFLLYTNYFGIQDEYVTALSSRYGSQLILDCAQAFYTAPLAKGHTFYSPRKFFGLPDGGLVYTDKVLDTALAVDVSLDRSTHLLKRIDQGAEAAYPDFKAADASLSAEPLKAMSQLTSQLLGAVDFSAAQQARVVNYKLLHTALGSKNKLAVPADPIGPLCYPFWGGAGLRDKLIAQKIFVPTYWPNVLEWSQPGQIEYELTTHLLALPIDQRYGIAEMEKIVSLLS